MPVGKVSTEGISADFKPASEAEQLRCDMVAVHSFARITRD